MSTEENKALLRRTYEAVNQKNLTAFFELFTPDFVLHNGSMTIQGLEAVKQVEALLLTALPDLHYTVEDMFAEGEKVAVRVTARGTHHGAFLGVSPTGKHTTVTEIAMSRIVGGKIAEHWSETDMLGLLQQLGAVPASVQLGQKSSRIRQGRPHANNPARSVERSVMHQEEPRACSHANIFFAPRRSRSMHGAGKRIFCPVWCGPRSCSVAGCWWAS